MNSGESNRPSLIAGGNGSPAGGKPSSRILADMEQRAPDTAGGTRIRRRALRWWLPLSGAVLVIAAVLLLGNRLWSPGSADAEPYAERETLDDSTAPMQAPAVESAGHIAREGAVIIDDPAIDPPPATTGIGAEAGEPARSASRDAADTPTITAAPAPVADPLATIATAPRRADAQTPQPAPRRTGSPSAAPSAKAQAGSENAALLATLLRIINQGESAQQPQHESMDALVAQIQTENQRTQTQTSAALASLGGVDSSATTTTAAPVRSPVVQEKLRACPKANTVAGIQCREQVCAQHAGEDAACPRR